MEDLLRKGVFLNRSIVNRDLLLVGYEGCEQCVEPCAQSDLKEAKGPLLILMPSCQTPLEGKPCLDMPTLLYRPMGRVVMLSEARRIERQATILCCL